MDVVEQDLFEQTLAFASVTPLDLLTALGSATVLAGLLALLYRFTHQGYSFSRSFLETLIIVSVTVTLIMVIIGSDIARAFALVGAMSIVRFRTPIKDSRDLVFVFAAIAIGMACGTQFIVFAAIFTVFVGALLLAFHFVKFGEVSNQTYVVKLRISADDKDGVSEVCRNYCRRHSILSINRISDSELEDVVYEVELKRGVNYARFIEQISSAVSPTSVNVLVGEGHVTV